MGVTFGYKPVSEKPPSWATHMIMVENDPEIWYFAHKSGDGYFVYDEEDHGMSVIHSMYTSHSIVYGGAFEIA